MCKRPIDRYIFREIGRFPRCSFREMREFWIIYIYVFTLQNRLRMPRCVQFRRLIRWRSIQSTTYSSLLYCWSVMNNDCVACIFHPAYWKSIVRLLGMTSPADDHHLGNCLQSIFFRKTCSLFSKEHSWIYSFSMKIRLVWLGIT